MANGMGGSIMSGAMSGAGTGIALGPGGAVAGAAIGGLMGFISRNQADKANQEIEDLINSAPSIEDSKAYQNAAAQAGRADRWAQEGLSSEVMNQATQNIDRTGGMALANANSLESGLMGMSNVTTSLTDAYRDLAVSDAQAKQANRGVALQANKDFQTIQEDLASQEIGTHQNMMDLALGRLSSDRQDSLNAQQSMGTGVQNLLNSPEGMERFGTMFGKMGGAATTAVGAGVNVIDPGTNANNMNPLSFGGVNNVNPLMSGNDNGLSFNQQPLSFGNSNGFDPNKSGVLGRWERQESQSNLLNYTQDRWF